MATCIAAYGADITIRNPIKTDPITVEQWIGAKEPKDIYPDSNVTGAGVKGEANWVAAALLGVATASEVMAHKLAYDEYRLAKREADLAQDVWNRFKSTYMPIEAKLAAYFMVRQPLAVAADKMRGDYQSFLINSWAKAEANFGRYRTCPPADYAKQLAWTTAILKTDVGNLSNQAEEDRDRDTWATWFNRRSTFLNLGQGILSATSSYIKQSMSLMAENRVSFMDIAAGAGYASGYRNMEHNLAERQKLSGQQRQGWVGGDYSNPMNNPYGQGVPGSNASASGAVQFSGDTGAPAISYPYGTPDMGYRGLEFSVSDRSAIDAAAMSSGSF